MRIPQAYGNYEAFLDERGIEVIHNCTPNDLHLPVTHGRDRARKACHCRQTARHELNRCADDARCRNTSKGIVHAVTFNYRYNPVIQHARVALQRGDMGTIHFIHGFYLQDWLLYPNDYNWRLEKEGGESRAVADIGSHWCDLAGYVTGSRSPKFSRNTRPCSHRDSSHERRVKRLPGGSERHSINITSTRKTSPAFWCVLRMVRVECFEYCR